MTDTQWADVSSWNPDVNDQYKLPALAIRSNDGTYRDSHFAYNLAWCKHACDTGKMDFFIVYFVFEPNWQTDFATFKAMVGTPHPKMAVMIDMESWNGRILGDQSVAANELRKAVYDWLGTYMSLTARMQGKHKKRVVGYGNAHDLTTLWPHADSDMKIVLANYSFNQAWPNKLAHQYGNAILCPPFGNCDMNSADGMTVAQVVAALGLDPTPEPKPPAPLPAPQPFYGSGYEKAIVSPNRAHALILFDDGRLSLYNNGKWVKNLG